VTSPEQLLAVRGLRVRFATEDGVVVAVDGIDFELARGKSLGIVGESGSGKSATALSLLGLTRGENAAVAGEIFYKGRNLLKLSESELAAIRGKEIAMVFQDPMTSLNPVQRVGDQIAEQIRTHEKVSARQADQRAIDLLGRVGIPAPKHRAKDYPHEFSGGMRQRVMIAMALSCEPAVLIADEPTTALDVTIQAQILELLTGLKQDLGLSLLLVTHDMGVIARMADEILVMYAGRIVEHADTRALFRDPQHPYTWGLLGSIPRIDVPRARRLPAIRGMPPSALKPPSGCRFQPRCPHAFERCVEEPELEARAARRHFDRCWLELESKRALGRKATVPKPVADGEQ
jgi:peptide/nickel transport system ATP-binding protein